MNFIQSFLVDFSTSFGKYNVEVLNISIVDLNISKRMVCTTEEPLVIPEEENRPFIRSELLWHFLEKSHFIFNCSLESRPYTHAFALLELDSKRDLHVAAIIYEDNEYKDTPRVLINTDSLKKYLVRVNQSDLRKRRKAAQCQ